MQQHASITEYWSTVINHMAGTMVTVCTPEIVQACLDKKNSGFQWKSKILKPFHVQLKTVFETYPYTHTHTSTHPHIHTHTHTHPHIHTSTCTCTCSFYQDEKNVPDGFTKQHMLDVCLSALDKHFRKAKETTLPSVLQAKVCQDTQRALSLSLSLSL